MAGIATATTTLVEAVACEGRNRISPAPPTINAPVVLFLNVTTSLRGRLNRGGLFLQSMQTYDVDAETVRTVYATLGSVFPQVSTWRTSEGDLLMVASMQPVTYDMNFLRQVSMKSGLPIVAGAGFYTQPFYPKEISSMSEEQVLQALMKQVESDPIGAFGEIGSWDYISKDERKVFRAIGKAHLLTNIPIFTHTGIPGKSALEQLDATV